MREIKFRAWDGKCYTTDFFITSEGTVFKPHYDRVAEIVSGFTIEQFTGLHDKNGKEIYEGDILQVLEVFDDKSKNYITPVIWEEGSFMVKNRTDGNYYDTFLCAYFNPEKRYPLIEYEVIGNIHETPELLENTKAGNKC